MDASSYLYRAFHALPDLRNRHNEPTGAIYGVLNMLRRLHQDYQADYSACVFDAKGKTFRDELYPEYKGHRPPMPPDLVAQIEPLHDAIRAMGWPLLAVEGVEADDVIGTLARLATEAGMRAVISTGDKDMAQLVNGQVSLINTMSNETLDEAGVAAKFGVPPARIVDYLTLIGDSADNVPGVAKVGPKTAVKWLGQYQTLDNLMAHAQEVGGAVGENLRNTLDWLPKARELLTIRCDVPLPVSLQQLTAGPQDNARLRELYERLEFKTWLRELPTAGRSEPAPTARPEPRYEAILDESQLEHWLTRLEQAELVSLDTETTGLDPMRAKLVGISFAIDPHHAAYFPLAHHYAGVPQQLDFAKHAAAPQALAGKPRHAQARAEPQVRQPHFRQPRHRPARHRPRHPAAILRAGKPQDARHGFPRRAPPRRQNHHLRRSHRQRCKTDRFRAGGARNRHDLCRRRCRHHPATASQPVPADQ